MRQEAEREALKQIAIQEGERLPDVDEDAALADEGADEPLDDYDDGEVCSIMTLKYWILCIAPDFLGHLGRF